MSTLSTHRTNVRFTPDGKQFIEGTAKQFGASLNDTARCALVIYATALEYIRDNATFLARGGNIHEQHLRLPVAVASRNRERAAASEDAKSVVVEFRLRPAEYELLERARIPVQTLTGELHDAGAQGASLPLSSILRAAWRFFSLIIAVVFTRGQKIYLTDDNAVDHLFLDKDILTELGKLSETLLPLQLPKVKLSAKTLAEGFDVPGAPGAETEETAASVDMADLFAELLKDRSKPANPDLFIRDLSQRRKRLRTHAEAESLVRSLCKLAVQVKPLAPVLSEAEWDALAGSDKADITLQGEMLLYVLSDPVCLFPARLLPDTTPEPMADPDYSTNDSVAITMSYYRLKAESILHTYPRDAVVRGAVLNGPLYEYLGRAVVHSH